MKRTFEVVSELMNRATVYAIVIKHKGDKKKSQTVSRVSGYVTAGFADADVVALQKHLAGKQRLTTFDKNCDGSNRSKKQKVIDDMIPSVKPSKKQKVLDNKIPSVKLTRKQRRALTGAAFKRREKGLRIKYGMYVNAVQDPIAKDEFVDTMMKCDTEYFELYCAQVQCRQVNVLVFSTKVLRMNRSKELSTSEISTDTFRSGVDC